MSLVLVFHGSLMGSAMECQDTLVECEALPLIPVGLKFFVASPICHSPHQRAYCFNVKGARLLLAVKDMFL